VRPCLKNKKKKEKEKKQANSSIMGKRAGVKRPILKWFRKRHYVYITANDKVNVANKQLVKLGQGYLPNRASEYMKIHEARHQWLMPVILAIWEAEIRRIMVGGHPGQ
jgi:hypothetical protein